ncbi:MAG: Rab family GTPase [Candidatus Helarchaeota archaeon]
MTEDLIVGIIYSQFDEIYGPTPVSWYPPDMSKELRNLVSLKSINMLTGEHGLVPESLAFLPFPSFAMGGLIKSIELKDETKRGGSIDSSITILFKEAHDPIFYKYFKNFESRVNEAAEKIVGFERSNIKKRFIQEELEKLHEDIIGYLKEMKDAELGTLEENAFPKGQEFSTSDRTYSYKIIVCGDPGVGKTSLILRFTNRAFRKTYLPTMGVNISEKRIRIENAVINFILWDLAGQTKFQTIRKHFYQGANGLLLVFDLTRPMTFKNITNWHDDIKKFSSLKIKGFILGNKCDLTDLREVSKEEIEKMAEKLNLNYIETSARTGEKVDDAFHELGEILLKTRS